MEPYKRDLPEIVAEILIEQHAMREEMSGMREDIGHVKEGIDRLNNLVERMTHAVLDAIDRQTSRYSDTNSEVADLRRRVELLENKIGRSGN